MVRGEGQIVFLDNERRGLVLGKVTSDNRLVNEPERESAWQESW